MKLSEYSVSRQQPTLITPVDLWQNWTKVHVAGTNMPQSRPTGEWRHLVKSDNVCCVWQHSLLLCLLFLFCFMLLLAITIGWVYRVECCLVVPAVSLSVQRAVWLFQLCLWVYSVLFGCSSCVFECRECCLVVPAVSLSVESEVWLFQLCLWVYRVLFGCSSCVWIQSFLLTDAWRAVVSDDVCSITGQSAAAARGKCNGPWPGVHSASDRPGHVPHAVSKLEVHADGCAVSEEFDAAGGQWSGGEITRLAEWVTHFFSYSDWHTSLRVAPWRRQLDWTDCNKANDQAPLTVYWAH